MFRSAVIAGICLTIAGVARAQTSVAADGPVIVAQGESAITEAPDRAWVGIAAEGRAPKTADAQRIAADAMASVQAALKAIGIPADAIRSTGYQLQPEYDYANGRQTFRDVLARHSIDVRVDDFATLGSVLDAAGASGASSVSGLRFDVKNREAVERDALKRAVQDGMDRAAAMATGAGRTLGGLVRIQEERTSAPTPTTMTMSALGAGGGRGGGVGTTIAPGEIEIRAQVTLTMSVK